MGIRLQPLPGGQLDVDAPGGLLTDELLSRLREHKAGLLMRLAPDSDEPQDGPRQAQSQNTELAHGSVSCECETDASPAGAPRHNPGNETEWIERIDSNGRRIWRRADTPEIALADIPDPCLDCGGIDQWVDLLGGWHCVKCDPCSAGPRLREIAQRLRECKAETLPLLTCGGDPGPLALSPRLLFHLGHAEQHAGDHLADRAVEIDLLADGDDPQASVAPVAQGQQPVANRA